jgi:predicted alpha/beta-hydrolase family hydrolase
MGSGTRCGIGPPPDKMFSVRTYAAASPIATLVLGHGAGAGEDHPWIRQVAQGLADRGITTVTFNFPYMEQKKRGAPDRPPVLEAAFINVWREVARGAKVPLFVGGKSMGGRMATHVAARHAFDPAPAGIILFGYPLHPPGAPTKRRDKHLPDVDVPILFLSGTRDTFATPDELIALAEGLPKSSLQLFEGGDHSIQRKVKTGEPLLDQAIAAAADWIRR